MSNVHNLDFGGVELGSCEALLARNFQRKQRAYQRTHDDCFLVFGKLVMVGGGIFAVGWCGFSLESLNSLVEGRTHTKSQFLRARALPIRPGYPVSDPTSLCQVTEDGTPIYRTSPEKISPPETTTPYFTMQSVTELGR